MQCKYPLDLNNSNPRAYAGMFRKLMPSLEEEKTQNHKPKTLQQKVWWLESEFIEGFFPTTFSCFPKALGWFCTSGGVEGWGSNSRFCKLPWHSVHLKAGVGIFQLTQGIINTDKLWSCRYILATNLRNETQCEDVFKMNRIMSLWGGM